MAAWKMPPIAKVYEALGAIGDGRVKLLDTNRAEVKSSDGAKNYTVLTSDDCRTIAANDNASFWQGYLGYPAIAVLIARKVLTAGRNAIDALRDVAWKELNKKTRNDYAKTIATIELRMVERGINPAGIREECERVLKSLRALKPERGERLAPAR